MDFSKYGICSFDCYGTLIDWERGIIASLKPVLSKYGIIAENEKILELYSAAETEAESEVYRPYKDILAMIVTSLGKNLEFTPSEEDKEAICGSIKYWRPFPDAVDALKKLKSNYKLAVISNIDDDLFEYSAEKLQVEFDHVITAQQVKSYKPSHNNFHEAMKRFGIRKDKILHIAQSLYHDIVPANKLGIDSIWVNRRSNRPGFGATPPAGAKPDLEVNDLNELVALMGL